MSKTIAQLQAELKDLHKIADNQKAFIETLEDKLTKTDNAYKEKCSLLEAEKTLNGHHERQINIAENELHRRDGLKPTDAIFEVLHKLELPEQISVINQVAAIKACTLRKKLAEAKNTAQYLENNLRSHENNMCNIYNGSTVQP